MMTEEGYRLLRAFESFVPLEYVCVAGRRTIGYGHVLDGGEHYPAGLTREQGEELLRRDVAFFEQIVRETVKAPLTDYQGDALISFAFNVGARAFAGSTLVRELNDGNEAAVPRELARWVYANGYVWRGLVFRRRLEGELFRTGNYVSVITQAERGMK